MRVLSQNLVKWKFAAGETEECLKNAREVTIPHTWNVEEGTEDYWGKGWYETVISVEEDWLKGSVRLFFRAVYHDAFVYVNGKKAGEHLGSGYTPFEINITEFLVPGENTVTVCASNAFSADMFPIERSFDWANDGGLIRPVELRVSGRQYLGEIQVTSSPVILCEGERQEKGAGIFGIQAGICGQEEAEDLYLSWKISENGQTLEEGSVPCENGMAKAANHILEEIRYWHFDAPELYQVSLSLKKGEELLDQNELNVGFRDFRVKNGCFFLNGERIRVCGTEWMPGSDPAYGMAELKEQLEKMLQCLKNTNCIYTRFHWQQDDWVYDWCDRHGMMIQEEIPFWGPNPTEAGPKQLAIMKKQMTETISVHRNHPSIITWGVGNELSGQNKVTIQYIKDAVAYTHELDPSRTVVYVSNSVFSDPAADGTTKGDILMVNDYIGTWHGDLDQFEEWKKIVYANPGRAMVPSEFGLCEPVWPGGDERRTEIFLEKMKCYRSYEPIAGTINFCLNDYRTQIGEDGEGRFRKRIHGSTDLCGNPKHSYYVIAEECAPLTLELKDGELSLHCREDLPCYTVKGYSLVMKKGEKIERTELPELIPGADWKIKLADKPEKIQILRPDGSLVGKWESKKQ